MKFNAILASKSMTKYKLSKLSGVPQTTVLDICSGKTKLENCASGTLFKLAKALGVSMEFLLEQRPGFEAFKSHVCHMVKEMGDLSFIIHILESNLIREYHVKHWHPETLYLLAMVDYLSRENELPLCTNYNDLRGMRLNDVVYPSGVHVRCMASDSEHPKRESLEASIPEFLRHNIVEAEVRDVC